MNVFQTFIMKPIPIFSECLLNVYFQTFAKMPVSKMGDFRGLCQKLPHMQFRKEFNGGKTCKQVTYNFRHLDIK